MSRNLFAVWTLLLGFIVGFLGMVMFYGRAVGLSYGIFAVLVFAAVIGSARYAHRPLNRRNVWLVVPVLLFAVMVAIRASEWLLFWNVTVSLVLAGLALHYIGLLRPYDLTSLLEQVGALIEAGLRVGLSQPLLTLTYSGKWFSSREAGESKQAIAVVRGLVITVPVLVVFGGLLGSADAVFGSYLARFQDLFALNNVDELIGRAILTGLLAWVVVGAIAYAVLRHWQPQSEAEAPEENEPTDEQDPPKRIGLPFRLGMIEGGMLLGGVSLLFGAFVLVQFVYLFGGRTNIGVDEMTYAEYARRGFFELVTAAVMAMGLILLTDRVTIREGKAENHLFRVLAFVIIGLVGVMLLSAARRMGLYTDAYGLTQLRLWTSVFMGWLAVLFGFLVLALLRTRQNVFSLGVIVTAIGFFVTMNALNPDARIASHNLERALVDGEDLDVCYLSYLSDDATPVIVEAYAQAEGENRRALAALLKSRELEMLRTEQSRPQDNSLLAMNLGRWRGDWAVTTLEDELQDVAPMEETNALLTIFDTSCRRASSGSSNSSH